MPSEKDQSLSISSSPLAQSVRSLVGSSSWGRCQRSSEFSYWARQWAASAASEANASSADLRNSS